MNLFFQSQTNRGRQWREDCRTEKKEKLRYKKECSEWEARANGAGGKVSLLEARNRGLELDLKIQHDEFVGRYMASDEFMCFMDQHDDSVRPDILTSGWDGALGAVSAQHPGMFNPSAFPSPYSSVEVPSTRPSPSRPRVIRPTRVSPPPPKATSSKPSKATPPRHAPTRRDTRSKAALVEEDPESEVSDSEDEARTEKVASDSEESSEE